MAYLIVQFCSRGMEDAPQRMTIDDGIIEQAIANIDGTDDQKDQFLNGLGWVEANVLSSLLNPDNALALKNWHKTEKIGGLEDEFTYGLGKTKDQAKAAFTDALSAAYGDDDEDEWDDDEED